MITCSNPRAHYLAHQEEIDEAVARVLTGGWYILGDEVRIFEEEFAAYVGVSHGVGVGSGTEALHLALKACGIGPGHEVITVSHTAVATVAAIELVGATPVLVDIEPDCYTMDPRNLAGAISSRTRAIVPVHVYGHPADLNPILDIGKTHGLHIIEDCAQAHGATYNGGRVGSFGDLACFSFYPTKNLGAIGDGGIVVTNNPELAERVKQLREYGWAKRYISEIPGWNSRLDELQAAILRIRLRYLDRDNEERRRIASRYEARLGDSRLKLPRVRAEAGHVYHLYVVRTSLRDELQQQLQMTGVSTLIHYPNGVHQQPAYRNRLPGSARLPVTEQVVQEVLSLPMYPELTESEVEQVIRAIHMFEGK